MMKQRIGIYPGTFDPIHLGHVAFAREAIERCNLDKVIFLPEHTPRGKRNVTNISDRVALIRKVTATTATLRIISLASKQFTVKETLPELHALFGDAELTMLLGSDVVRTLPHHWEGLDILLREMPMAIGMRTNDGFSEVTATIKELEQRYGMPIRHELIYTASAGIASSHIRYRTADLSGLYTATRAYIQEARP